MEAISKNTYESSLFMPYGSWTSGVEGPACDVDGNLYAVNYKVDHNIGKVTPSGEAEIFVTLPNGSIGNGIRFNSKGDMLIADYTNHNILRVDMKTRNLEVYAHDPSMYQPNDIAITSTDIVFASDPDWPNLKGRIWRIMPDGSMKVLDENMGTTNGIEVSPDDKVLYVNESEQRRIWAYDLSPSGEVSNKRLFVEFPDYGMDGMRCDVNGNLFITRYHKGTVLKMTPDAVPVLEVHLDGKRCSNICFGGDDGCTCYVTMADTGCIETFRTDIPGREWMLYRKWGLAK